MTNRATISIPVLATNGTIARIGLAGHVCAQDVVVQDNREATVVARAAPANSRNSRRATFMMSPKEKRSTLRQPRPSHAFQKNGCILRAAKRDRMLEI